MSELSREYDEGIKGLFYQALASELGIEVRTSDPTRFINTAYRVRRLAGDEQLSGVLLRRSPTQPDRIWLVRESALAAQAAEEGSQSVEVQS